MSSFPTIRLRRLRKSPQLRRMIGTPLPGPEKFLWPVFITEGEHVRNPITLMPNQYQFSIDELCRALEKPVRGGLGGIMLFGVIDEKDKSEDGAYASRDDGLVQRGIQQIQKE